MQEKKVAQAAKVMERNDAGASGPRPGMPRPAWLERLLEKPRQFAKFLHEVRAEMTHVTWPSVADVRSTTLVVIVTVFFFGIFFFFVDLGVSRVVQLLLKQAKP
jgi:preprotein translocase subunit SecE